MAVVTSISPIIIKRSSGHIFKPTPWCSRKQHLEKIRQIIGDGQSIRRDSSIDDYYLKHFIETHNEGIFTRNILYRLTSLCLL